MALLSRFTRKCRININPRLILYDPRNPDPQKRYFVRRIGSNTTFLTKSLLKRAFGVLVILLLPISVSAGLFGGLFSKNIDTDPAQFKKNLQTMNLLAAATSPSPDTSGYDTTVEGNALVPVSGPSGTVADVSSHKPTSDQISVYVVREGDTLSQIAQMFDVTPNTIKWSNDLASNTLKAGDTLVILPVTGVKYVVSKGDTLASVAKKYKGDIDEIAAYNNIDKGSGLAVGSTIIIPDGEVASTPSAGTSVSVPRSSSGLKTYEGYYLRPLVGGKKTQGIHGYNAVDLGAPVGTPIIAAADGEVIIARSSGWNGGYGNYIVIKHPNGTQTLYAHASQTNVSSGDSVNQGDVIGLVGATGKATGPHLHFEIRGAKNPF